MGFCLFFVSKLISPTTSTLVSVPICFKCKDSFKASFKSGNDVCNEHPDTVAHMTSPSRFRLNTLAALDFLEERLSPGSHVVLVGLIDGGIIYDAMAHRSSAKKKVDNVSFEIEFC